MKKLTTLIVVMFCMMVLVSGCGEPIKVDVVGTVVFKASCQRGGPPFVESSFLAFVVVDETESKHFIGIPDVISTDEFHVNDLIEVEYVKNSSLGLTENIPVPNRDGKVVICQNVKWCRVISYKKLKKE